MRAWIVPPIPGLIEPSVAPEFFVNGIGAIERIGDSLRFYLAAEQLPLEVAAGEPQHIVTVKIVRPMRGLSRTAMQLLQCLDCDDFADCRRGGPPWTPRLVR